LHEPDKFIHLAEDSATESDSDDESIPDLVPQTTTADSNGDPQVTSSTGPQVSSVSDMPEVGIVFMSVRGCVFAVQFCCMILKIKTSPSIATSWDWNVFKHARIVSPSRALEQQATWAAGNQSKAEAKRKQER